MDKRGDLENSRSPRFYMGMNISKIFKVWEIPLKVTNLVITFGMPVKGHRPNYLLKNSTFKYSEYPLVSNLNLFISSNNIIVNKNIIENSNVKDQAIYVYTNLVLVGLELFYGHIQFTSRRTLSLRKMNYYILEKRNYFKYSVSKI